MILNAGNGCYLTQSADIPAKERVFRPSVMITDPSEVGAWKEVTAKQKDEMMAQSAIIDVNDMDVESIKRVDAILSEISTKINDVPMSMEQAIELTGYFPKWDKLEGQLLEVGFRCSYNGSLFEVTQPHTVQAGWNPKEAISLFKVVQIEAEGTEDDLIQWESGMELFNGKYYVENGVKYLCIRDSGIHLYHNLNNLIGQYVEVVE